jgi:hypothetical protein
MAEIGEGRGCPETWTSAFACEFSHGLLIAFCFLPFLSGPKTTSHKRWGFCVQYLQNTEFVRGNCKCSEESECDSKFHSRPAGRNSIIHVGFWWENLKERGDLEDFGVDIKMDVK